MLFISNEVPKNWRETMDRRIEQLKKAEQAAAEYREKNFSKTGGVILEWTEIGGNNGTQPRRVPFHWVCGNDRGHLVDPPGITTEDDPVHFIATTDEAIDPSRIERHGALPSHPTLSDARAWGAPLFEVDFSPEVIQARITALTEAKSANETEVCKSDVLPVGSPSI